MYRLLLAVLLALAAPAAAQEKPLLVFAAASLQTALPAIAAEWKRETGREVTFSYAASSALARQIDQGAPADLFISADMDWMEWAEKRNLMRPGTRRTIAGGALVLIAAKDDTTRLKLGRDMPLLAELGTSRLAMGEPSSVPAGRYGKAALEALGKWQTVAGKVAAADNVRAALTLVARGEARFGIVYASDAQIEPRVRIVDTFEANLHPPIAYPAAVTAVSAHPQAAKFLAYLASNSAHITLQKHGFMRPR